MMPIMRVLAPLSLWRGRVALPLALTSGPRCAATVLRCARAWAKRSAAVCRSGLASKARCSNASRVASLNAFHHCAVNA